MVTRQIAGGLRRARVVAAVFAALLSFPAAAQKQLTLEEVNARTPPDSGPAHGGETVTFVPVVLVLPMTSRAETVRPRS